jgi:hypothetical protein
MNWGRIKLIQAAVLLLFCHSSMAALLDFTHSDHHGTGPVNTYSGTFNGIGFTLSSNVGNISIVENYDGSQYTGCQSNGGVLACSSDGVGIDIGDPKIDSDEINGIDNPAMNQILTITFDQVVKVSGFYFLDMYVNPKNSSHREQATIIADGVFVSTVSGNENPGEGGYAELLINPIYTKTLEFSASFLSQFWDDGDNDYALAAVDVSPVPLPPAIWLFGTAIAGLLGMRRTQK